LAEGKKNNIYLFACIISRKIIEWEEKIPEDRVTLLTNTIDKFQLP